jgi:hypothetical protein
MSQTSSCYQQKIISRQILDVFCVQNGASLLTKQYCIQSKAYRQSNFFPVSNRKHPKQSKASQPAHMYAGHCAGGKKRLRHVRTCQSHGNVRPWLKSQIIKQKKFLVDFKLISPEILISNNWKKTLFLETSFVWASLITWFNVRWAFIYTV